MVEFFQQLFDSSFMPHGHCYLWKPGLVWLKAGADILLALAYFLISYLLFWFVRRRKDLAFRWMFALGSLLFGLCALTHVMGTVTIWYGTYWFEGSLDMITGAGSMATALLLAPVVPKALDLPTPTELRKANEALEKEIKQRKEAEKELEEAYEKLKETERLKDEFFANVSHELRTPLTLILSPVESILEEDVETGSSEEGSAQGEAPDTSSSEETSAQENASKGKSSGVRSSKHRQRLETIHNNSLRMLQMVNGLLDFSKLEIGEVEVAREPTQIDELTRSICQDFRPLSERKGLDLDYDCTIEASIVDMDRYLYERILFNLLSNAVKFTAEGGEVWVRLSQENDRLELTVADTGEGIPEEELEDIFKDFRQVDASSTRRFEGTGLGLPLVKEFTELLDGGISVESTPGVGSTFTVELHAPISDQEERPEKEQRPHTLAQQYGVETESREGRQTEERTAETDTPHSEGEQRTIGPASNRSEEERLSDVVLAEDNEELSAYIKDLLAGTCTVHVAQDGEEAFELIQQVHPALVITDIMMPKEDGLDLCRTLKANPATADIPVVMLTALTNRKALLRGWEAGADEYLFKPFHPKELVTRIRTLLRNVERRKEAEAVQKQLERELLQTSERERRRIGQDIHDGLASHMTGLMTIVQSLKEKGGEEEETLTIKAKSLDRIVDLARDGARQARALARGLNPVKLDEKGLPAALQTLAENQEFRYELTCVFQEDSSRPDLSQDQTMNLYWIAHEAVQNAIQHGNASRVSIWLGMEDGKTILEVTDDGTGLPDPVEEIEDGMGLATMRYRTELIGGRLKIQNRAEGGVRVVCTLPTPSSPEASTSEASL